MSYQGNTFIPVMLDGSMADIMRELEKLSDFEYDEIRTAWYQFAHVSDWFNEKLGETGDLRELAKICTERRQEFIEEILGGEPPENLWRDWSEG